MQTAGLRAIRIRILASIAAVSVGACTGGAETQQLVSPEPPPASVTVSVSGGDSIDEGLLNATLVFELTLSEPSTQDVEVSFESRSGTATSADDFVGRSGTLTIPSGSTSATVSISVVGDSIDEPDETMSLVVTSATNADIGTSSATGTILDDDPPPSVSVLSASVTEGDSGQATMSFSVELSAASGFDVNVDFDTSDGSATAGEDYQAASGQITIPAGSSGTTVAVNVNGDVADENDETFTLTLSNPGNATLGAANADGTIVDDDTGQPSEPVLSIVDASLTEGDSGSATLLFTVVASAVASADIEVDYTTGGGTAQAGADYVSVSGTATILSGSSTTTVDVAIIGDEDDEGDETFNIMLSNPVNATIGDGLAVGTIVDDDNSQPSEPVLSIADASLTEGDSGTATLTFTLSATPAPTTDVDVDYATGDGTAQAGADYVSVSGSATILSGASTTTVDVTIIGDEDDENDETFDITLSNPVNASIGDGIAVGTIIDDDSSVISGLDSRPSNLTCIAPDRPIVATGIATENAFPSLPSLVDPVGLMQAPGDTSQWYVVEKDGRVRRFDNTPGVNALSDFIDIRSGSPIDVDSGAGEAGLLGMAFHPDYGNGNWYVYLSYMIDGAGTGDPFVSVIARFESKDNGLTLDENDATTLLTLNQPFNNHNGGQIAFGPDGYLYISFGDGGSGGDPGDRAQDTENLHGAMLRIDVDGGSPYAVPGDNPFAGNALCDDGDGNAACPEIYAWGLRNPWKWSFDSATGDLWLGDVGQNAWEEIDVVELGGNYGWRCREGAHDFNTSGVCPAGLIDPVIEYPHSVGNSVTGGVVYRGNDIAELTGRYVFADYAQGKLFASVDNGDGTLSYEQLLNTSFFISAFATEADGEMLFLDYRNDVVRRIVPAGGGTNDQVATELSGTGCVDVADPSQPVSGLIPYDINVPFWSDGAVKDRWYAIPDGTTIDVAPDGDWLFPIGTVLMKHFRLNGELIETRLFMRHTDGVWAGYSYEWNATGTDADRLFGSKTKTISGQDWIYPSGSQCLECHTAAANFSLGIEHGHLNKNFTYPSTGIDANQLVTADFVDLLTDPLSDTPDNLPRFPDPTDLSESLEDRARAYLHSNCAGCHRPGGPTPSNMDLRFATALADTDTCDVVPTSGDLGIANARIVAPGDAASSVLVVRTDSRDVHGMPPLGSTVVDAFGVQLLTDWVNSLTSCP